MTRLSATKLHSDPTTEPGRNLDTDADFGTSQSAGRLWRGIHGLNNELPRPENQRPTTNRATSKEDAFRDVSPNLACQNSIPRARALNRGSLC